VWCVVIRGEEAKGGRGIGGEGRRGVGRNGGIRWQCGARGREADRVKPGASGEVWREKGGTMYLRGRRRRRQASGKGERVQGGCEERGNGGVGCRMGARGGGAEGSVAGRTLDALWGAVR